MTNGNSQMELGFDNKRVCQPLTRRQKRLSRATWWFARMRQVVDHAIDWGKTPTPRPEQICFPHILREPAVITEERRTSSRLQAAWGES